MEKSYFRTLAEHFVNLKYTDLNDETLYHVGRSLVNYLGGSIYTASHQHCEGLLALIRSLDREGGKAYIWTDDMPANADIAAFSNAARLSSLELNDGTKSSAHPGIYVWSAALATYQQYGGTREDLVRSVVFGYEVCTRMAMLCVNKILELGLHNPGFVGGLGAVAAAGLMRGLSVDQLCNAFGITAALLPLCPFVSFVEGADSKDLYGGWGVHLAMFAVDGAARNLTGPETVLKGMKSLDKIFRGDAGKEIELGDPYLVTWTHIKQYPACFAINPAVNAVFELQKRVTIDPEQIASVLVSSYPYSYDLNQGVGRKFNTTSGRLSLYYNVAVAFIDGIIAPSAFSKAEFNNPRYRALQEKITTERHNDYGDGPDGIRGCVIYVTMKDGTVYEQEYNATNTEVIYTDEMLYEKFCGLTEGAITAEDQKKLFDFAMSVSKQDDLNYMFELMRKLPRIA